MQTTPALEGRASRGDGFRWVVCALLFLATTINYIDRGILGILKTPLAAHFQWNEKDYANIVTAFTFAYAFGYAAAGWAMDKLGVKVGLPLALGLWSIAAAGHGLVAQVAPAEKWIWAVPMSVAAFCALRLALGLFQGGHFPVAIKGVAEWFPVKERALATGLFNAGSTAGAIVCPLLVPWLAGVWEWPAAFYITGALGVPWLMAWALLYRNPPGAAEELVVVTGAAAERVPWVKLLTYRATWAYVAGMALSAPVWWFYLFWGPAFLQKQFGLTVQQVGLPVAVVYAMTLVGSVGGGWLPSVLMGKGLSVNGARKLALLVPALCAVPVAAVPFAPNLWTAVVLLGFAASAHQAWSANLYTLVSDTMPKSHVSSVVGIGGLVAGLAAMGAAQVVGMVLQATGSYVWLLVGCCCMYLVAMGIIQVLVPRIGAVKAEPGGFPVR